MSVGELIATGSSVDVTDVELTDFVRGLTAERRFFNIGDNELGHNLFLVHGYSIQGVLAGIAGITRNCGVYATFYMVHRDWQGCGIGTELARVNHERARFLGLDLLVTVVDAANTPAVCIPKRLGYHTALEHNGRLYMFYPFNRRGKLMGSALLPLALKLYLSLPRKLFKRRE